MRSCAKYAFQRNTYHVLYLYIRGVVVSVKLFRELSTMHAFTRRTYQWIAPFKLRIQRLSTLRSISPKMSTRQQKFDFLLVLDFEATCERGSFQPIPQEIIEFPCLKMNTATWSIDSVFHRYVRPVANPTLTSFCTELTGIVQEMVDNGTTLEETLKQFDEWLKSEGLLSTESVPVDEGAKNWAFVTCGDWDLKTMLKKQCEHLGYQRPDYFRRWINVKRSYYQVMKAFPKGMMEMLAALNLSHEGAHHSGIDDARNIAKIAKALAMHGLVYDITGVEQ